MPPIVYFWSSDIMPPILSDNYILVLVPNLWLSVWLTVQALHQNSIVRFDWH